MICKYCKVQMVQGTSYENSDGRHHAKRYDECPKCHNRKYNNSVNFQEVLVNTFKSKK